MALSMIEVSFALHIISSVLIGAFFRLLKIKTYSKYVYSIVGILQIIIFCGLDSLHFAIMVLGATWMITSFVKNPKVIFGFCLAYRIFFSSSKHLGFYRDEKNLANSLMLVATIKMILVAYEVFDYRNKDGKSKQMKYQSFGILQLEQEPTQLDIICYMTCFVGLFTGPIYKYRTFHDMIMSPYRPISHALKNQVQNILGATVVFLVGHFLFNINYFTSEYLLTDTHIFRLLHVYPVGFLYQMRYVVVWLLGNGICMLVGMGMYPNTSNPSPGKGPTQYPQSLKLSENQEETTTVYNFKTVENIRPIAGIMELSFWKTLHHWNCCVQWWLSQFIYRSDVLPKHMRGARAFSTLFFSAIWHGIKPGYFMCLLPLPFFAALEESCFYLQRRYIKQQNTRNVLCGFHWLFVKIFCYASFFVSFMLLDYHLIWKFLQDTYFACYLMPVVMLLVNLLFVFCSYLFSIVHKNVQP